MYEFDKENHIHTLDGKPLFGVTTVLGVLNKPALIQWSANEAVKYVGEEIAKKDYGSLTDLIDDLQKRILNEAKTAHRKKRDKAGDIGTAVHKACEEWIKDKKIPILDEKGMAMFQNFVNWATVNKVEFLESEINVYSREMWVGGICDMVFKIGDKVFIGDIKTSSGIYPEYFFQTAAYQGCLQEMGYYPSIHGHTIVNLNKNGTMATETVYGIDENFKAFKSALYLHKMLKKLETITK